MARNISLEETAHRPIEVASDREGELLGFCKRWGLIGLLPHTVLSARLGAWRVQRSYEGWELQTWAYEPDEEYWAEIIETDLEGGADLAGDDAWFSYFPDVREDQRETHRPKVPMTDAFWTAYGEPVDHFLRTARLLADALEVLGDRRRDPKLREWPDFVLDRPAALARLNRMVYGVTPAVVSKPRRRFEQTWHSPSLLGHLAMNAQQDLLQGARWLKCNCGVSFLSAHPTKKCCSQRCSDRYRQQRHRALR